MEQYGGQMEVTVTQYGSSNSLKYNLLLHWWMTILTLLTNLTLMIHFIIIQSQTPNSVTLFYLFYLKSVLVKSIYIKIMYLILREMIFPVLKV